MPTQSITLKSALAWYPHTSEMWQLKWILGSVVPLIWMIGLFPALLGLIVNGFSARARAGAAIVLAAVVATALLTIILIKLNRGRPVRTAVFFSVYYAMALLMLAATMVMSMVMAPLDPTLSLGAGLVFVPSAVMAPLAYVFGTRRVGDELYCSACGYEQAPGLPPEATEVCPECGARWREPKGVRKGRLVRPWHTTVMMSLVIVIGFPLATAVVNRRDVQRTLFMLSTRITGFDAVAQDLAAERFWRPLMFENVAAMMLTDAQFDHLCNIIVERAQSGDRHNTRMAAGSLFADPTLSEQRCTRLQEAASRNTAHCTAESNPAGVPQFHVSMVPVDGLDHLYDSVNQVGIQRWLLPFAYPCGNTALAELHGAQGVVPLSQSLPAMIDRHVIRITFTPCDVSPATTPTITIPIMLVAAPWPTRPQQSPPPPIINPDGNISPPPGALWSRTVNLTIPVTRAD